MNRKTKGRAGKDQATQKTSSKLNSTGIAPRVKVVIVTLVVWGLFPGKVAEWIIRRGGLRHA